MNTIDAYIPINHISSSFVDYTKISLEQGSELKIGIRFLLNGYTLDEFKRNNKLSIVLTKDAQYNIIENIPIDNSAISIYDKDNCFIMFLERIYLMEGIYKAYVGVTPTHMPMKYISKPLLVEIIKPQINN